MYRALGIAIVVSLLPTVAVAQTDESNTVSAIETTLTTETVLDETAFELPAPTGWEFFKRRFVHFFTFGEVRRLRQELELANLTLVAAEEAEAAGDVERAAKIVDEFTAEMERISGRVNDAAADLASRTDDAQVQALLEQIQTDRLLQASLAEQLSATTQAELQAKALKARASALRDLAKLLAADSPTPEKFQERLTKIAQKLAEREAKLERKIAKRLAAFEAIDDEIDDPEFEDVIEEEEGDELDDVAALDPDRLGAIVREIEGSLAKHVLVLQSLLDRVPEQARPAIQAAIDRSVERLKERLTTDADFLEEIFDEDHEAELQEKILERLEDETEEVAEAVEEAIKTQREATKKALERERERAKKALEVDDDADEIDDDDEGQDEADDGEEGDADTETKPSRTTGGTTGSSGPSSGAGSAGSSGTGSSPRGDELDDDEGEDEIRTETKEIEIEDSRFKTTNLEVKKGTRLTVNLKNKDSVAHDFSIVGASTTTGSVSPDGEKSVTFTVDSNLEFYCSLHSSVPHGTITMKN